MSNDIQESTDIFHWANKIDGVKRDLDIELFFFNKNFTPYRTNLSADIQKQLPPLFLFDLINFVNLGAGTGLSVHDITFADGENILRRTDLGKVGRAETLVYLLNEQKSDIVMFNELEHEFKRMKGVIARFTHPTDKSIKFDVVKLIKQSDVISGGLSWQLDGGLFDFMKADVTFKMPADNQVLIIDQDIFVFNPAKFTTLFSHDARAIAAAEKIGAEIDKTYKLTMPTIGQGIAFMATEKPGLLKKLLAVQPGLITQEQVIEIADEMQIELMSDDAGNIILMDYNDVGVFLDILLDNFMQSEATGTNYLVKNKKPLAQGDE